MSHPKHGRPDHPVHPLITQRWSPYAYSDKPVSREDLLALFEAARWAASSYNEQPWVFLVATKDQPEDYAKLLSCLVEPNQAWAKQAPVLVLACIRTTFSRNGAPNPVAAHDLGLASGNLCLEATARGLQVHQMGGIVPDRARVLFGVPEGVQPFTAIAIGYAADPASLPDQVRVQETTPRTRKPLAEIVHSGAFGKSWG
ncbi:MAG: nitroreductase family protein [Gemmataceae bacterium]|jgi:nitroreductase|nr:nitroreductase family protein [Gemmataceae bacterium]